jgi:tetratricopeptide (TPR) repeat protein
MRDPRLSRFTITPEASKKTFRIDYSPVQLQRMRVYACAAAGAVDNDLGATRSASLVDLDCARFHALESTDDELRALARRARASLIAGDPNYVIKRGALMHADIAMGGPLPTTPIDQRPAFSQPSLGPQSFLMHTTDGQSEDLGQTAIHWEIGRMLLDDVRPKGAQKPSPSTDEMVRLWYRATAAWMQNGEHLNKVHLNHAREIFPHDADILFLLGCLHETFADAQVQSVVRSTPLPIGIVMDMEGEQRELKLAEDALREALAVQPDAPEARLRFGRVIALRGRSAEAIHELRRALELLPADESTLHYYGELFVGGAEEDAGHYDESRAAFERAATLYPNAQSPYLGLSELARRRGDRRSALDAMKKVFELPPLETDRLDPWWGYHVFQARDTDQLLDRLWEPFRTQSGPRK